MGGCRLIDSKRTAQQCNHVVGGRTPDHDRGHQRTEHDIAHWRRKFDAGFQRLGERLSRHPVPHRDARHDSLNGWR